MVCWMEKSVIHILEIPGKKSSYYDNLILSYLVITLYFVYEMYPSSLNAYILRRRQPNRTIMASESKALDMQICKKNLVQDGNLYCPDFEYMREY